MKLFWRGQSRNKIPGKSSLTSFLITNPHITVTNTTITSGQSPSHLTQVHPLFSTKFTRSITFFSKKIKNFSKLTKWQLSVVLLALTRSTLSQGPGSCQIRNQHRDCHLKAQILIKTPKFVKLPLKFLLQYLKP